ncbi:glycosyltransferase [Stappia sp. GBMRC 2046]|uniref:Glycosyltransferase n=1 Tax=Stappia sediminis TaxID=2692190 RepID=A0A7X3LSN0_9HYPH|nr:glycosyltransferase family 4 protein [Stappia sediminis]MXN64359.1 glycosyltransferase [Stappia sediminis]
MSTKPSDVSRSKPEDMRVLVISHGHPDLSLGGAEVASYNLHKGLNELEGVRSFFMARVGSPYPRHSASALMGHQGADDEILYFADDYDHFLLSNRNTDDIRRDLQRFLRTLRPDVVHFHHFIGLGLETLFAVRETLPEAAIIVTFHEFLSLCHHHGQMVKTGGTKLCNAASPIACHGCFPDISPGDFLRRERFVQSMLQIADHYISPSRFLAERYIRWGLPGNRMKVIENGLNISSEAEPRRLSSEEDRRGRFAFFGQLTPYKGADVLLDAIGRVPETAWGDDARLMIFGGNLERQPEWFQKKIGESIEKAGDRVRFYGSYQNSEMPRLMRSADWVVIPSVWWENSPIVIQEAFFHRRPLISSNIGGMAEKIRDGVDGMHFRVGSAEDLADRMTEALTEPDLWERLRAGIRRPSTHVECAEAHLELYRGLVEGTSALDDDGTQAMKQTA